MQIASFVGVFYLILDDSRDIDHFDVEQSIQSPNGAGTLWAVVEPVPGDAPIYFADGSALFQTAAAWI